MSNLQEPQKYQTLTKPQPIVDYQLNKPHIPVTVGTGKPAGTVVTFTTSGSGYFSFFPGWPTSHVDITPEMEPLILVEYTLAHLGSYLATVLTKVLDELGKYNQGEAIDSIVSILEPYMETNQELDLHMPPISSRRVTLNVTNRGRAKPNLYVE